MKPKGRRLESGGGSEGQDQLPLMPQGQIVTLSLMQIIGGDPDGV